MQRTTSISVQPGRRIRVLCVDDSAMFRRFLGEILEPLPDIEVAGFAADPYIARDRLHACDVDVLTLDLEMPRMAGLTFLRLLMEQKPMPVVVLSSTTRTGSQQAVEALYAGAAAVLGKPESYGRRAAFAQRLAHDIRMAAHGSPLRPRPAPPVALARSMPPAPSRSYHSRQIIAVGASTGGAPALERLLGSLPPSVPGMFIVQHIPERFCAALAKRLSDAGPIKVRVASEGDTVEPGQALLAPGDRHLEVQRVGGQYRAHLTHGAPVEHQRPSIDVLFRSLAATAGSHALPILLSGMGCDGAAGMKQLFDLGAVTLVQDAASSVVYGMAREAVRLDAVSTIVPLDHLGQHVLKALQQRQSTHPHLIHA
jgi:two-component system chemotaxis response regulator CheB